MQRAHQYVFGWTATAVMMESNLQPWIFEQNHNHKVNGVCVLQMISPMFKISKQPTEQTNERDTGRTEQTRNSQMQRTSTAQSERAQKMANNGKRREAQEKRNVNIAAHKMWFAWCSLLVLGNHGLKRTHAIRARRGKYGQWIAKGTSHDAATQTSSSPSNQRKKKHKSKTPEPIESKTVHEQRQIEPLKKQTTNVRGNWGLRSRSNGGKIAICANYLRSSRVFSLANGFECSTPNALGTKKKPPKKCRQTKSTSSSYAVSVVCLHALTTDAPRTLRMRRDMLATKKTWK